MGQSRASAAVEWRPQPGKQTAFLASPADIAIYGGAAGGGKTWCLLIEPLRHISNPDFRAVIFRRTSPQISNPGGLWDEAQRLYPLLGATANQTLFSWHFPSGAVVRFAHLQLERHKYDWQGAQIPLIQFDELTHFTEDQFFYMLSRNRSTCGVRPYVRATTNPDAESWVARLVAWWIDPDTGFPIPERAGVLRHFVRVGEELIWDDSAAALRARYPNLEVKSLTFIPARLEDNPILMRADPGYLANLLALPLVERERLYGGNWKIAPSAGKVFNRDWFAILPIAPPAGEACRFWDFASTAKELAGDDPDYTAGVCIRRLGDFYYVLDCVAAQVGPAAGDSLLLRTTRQDLEQARRDNARYRVRWEIEPGSAGVKENMRLIKLLEREFGVIDAKGVHATGDKLTRARGLAQQSEAGFVSLVRGDWNEAWLNHMHRQPDYPHDDIMDASAGAFNDLAGIRSRTKPEIYRYA